MPTGTKTKKMLPIALSLLIALCGCSAKSGPVNTTGGNNKELCIVTSFYPIYVFTLNIVEGIAGVKTINMTKTASGCLHDYSLTTDDMRILEKARMFVINGAGMESFMDKVARQFPHLMTVDSSKGLKLLKDKSVGGSNPHVWVSISNAMVQVRNIGSRLAAIDRKNAVKYMSNTDRYVKKLKAERDKMHKALSGIKTRNIITFHEAFPYFAEEFGLNVVSVIEREPGSQPSAYELADIIGIVKSSNVKALFAEPQYPSKTADVIAKETGAKVYVLDPVVTGPPDADAYVDIMDENLKVLQEALK